MFRIPKHPAEAPRYAALYDPITPILAIGSLVATVAGGAVSALGAIQQGQATAAADRYQAQVARNNQQLAAWKAGQAAKVGEQDLYNQGLKRRAQMGAIIAGEAASGVDVNSGSALKVQQSQELLGQTEAEQTSERMGREVYGYRTQGASYANEAALQDAAAANASTAGFFDAGGSLLGSAASVGTKYVDWQHPGIGASATPLFP